MKVFLFLTLILLISVSIQGCSVPVQQASQAEPLAQAYSDSVKDQTNSVNAPKAKVAWYDTETADMIATSIAIVAVGICTGYWGAQLFN